MAKKPNIVFFFTDDQRFDTIRALGNDQVLTPNMDRLVERGTTFTHAHIPGGSVQAVCMPSRAMLHTGRTLFHIDGAGERISPDHTTMGEALGGNGYKTFGIGKWHNGGESFNRGFQGGDEIFLGGMCDHWNVPAFRYDPSGRYDATLPMCTNPARSNNVLQRRCDHVIAGKHSTELIGDAAVEFLSRYRDDAPFFLYVSFLAPHDPRVMPKRYRDLYDPNTVHLPDNFMDAHPFDNGELRVRDEMLAGFPRTPEEIREHIADYYAMISHLDAEIGRVIQVLEEQGRMDNTLIVLAGDNGLALGRHGLMGKQNCYDHSVRVPLVFSGPGIPANRRTDALVYLLDIFPTLCELADIKIPSSVEGESLANAMSNTRARVRETLYLAYSDKHRAVRDRRHKLIEYVVNSRHAMTQLFDLENDPLELENLAENPTYASKVAELRAEMTRYRQAWDDQDSEWGRRFWNVCKWQDTAT